MSCNSTSSGKIRHRIALCVQINSQTNRQKVFHKFTGTQCPYDRSMRSYTLLRHLHQKCMTTGWRKPEKREKKDRQVTGGQLDQTTMTKTAIPLRGGISAVILSSEDKRIEETRETHCPKELTTDWPTVAPIKEGDKS